MQPVKWNKQLPGVLHINSMAIEQRRIFIAPPGYHLLLEDGVTCLSKGPRVNYNRPAIDPLFFSAATAYQSCVVGVVLTGMLDDGAMGLAVIKRCGGIAVVQEPEDARFPSMPKSAIEADHPDFIVPLSSIADTIFRAENMTKEPDVNIGEEIKQEVRFLKDPLRAPYEDSGEFTSISCPECGGPMRKKYFGSQYRYRCHTGHSYTGKWLLSAQNRASEESLWNTARALEERAKVERELAENERVEGRDKEWQKLIKQAEETESHVRAVQDLIMKK